MQIYLNFVSEVVDFGAVDVVFVVFLWDFPCCGLLLFDFENPFTNCGSGSGFCVYFSEDAGVGLSRLFASEVYSLVVCAYHGLGAKAYASPHFDSWEVVVLLDWRCAL